MFLGEIIREYRHKNNLTLKDFSVRSGLSVAYINQLERNRNPKTGTGITPSLSTFFKVAKAMNMSVDQLLLDVDESQPVRLSPRSDDDSSLFKDTFLPINSRLASIYSLLNEEGIEKLIEYAEFLLSSGKYLKKSCSDELVEEDA